MKIKIKPNGDITFIYSDKTTNLHNIGKTTIKRASHVEPINNQWYADLYPLNGPKLGPFKLKSKALEEEEKWLQENLINLEKTPDKAREKRRIQ